MFYEPTIIYRKTVYYIILYYIILYYIILLYKTVYFIFINLNTALYNCTQDNTNLTYIILDFCHDDLMHGFKCFINV